MFAEPWQTRFDGRRFQLGSHHASWHSGVVNLDDNRQISLNCITDDHAYKERLGFGHVSSGDACSTFTAYVSSWLGSASGWVIPLAKRWNQELRSPLECGREKQIPAKMKERVPSIPWRKATAL